MNVSDGSTVNYDALHNPSNCTSSFCANMTTAATTTSSYTVRLRIIIIVVLVLAAVGILLGLIYGYQQYCTSKCGRSTKKLRHTSGWSKQQSDHHHHHQSERTGGSEAAASHCDDP